MMRFKSNVEELKKHIETHGHMNVTVKENRALNTWMSRIRTSYKQIKEGRPPHLNLTLDHIEILRQIGFDFESRTLLFEDRVEALRRYQAKHGHMNPTKREDKALFIFISNVKQTVKMMKEGHPKPLLKLPPHRMKMLEQIGFDFFKRKVVPFEVRIEALKDYKAKHGHTNVSFKEDKSLHVFVANIKKSARRMKEGQKTNHSTSYTNLTPDRMKILEQIGFEFGTTSTSRIPFEARIEALKNYKAKHGHMNVSKKEDKSLHVFISKVRQSVKRKKEGRTPMIKLTPIRITTLKEIGFDLRLRRSRACISQSSSTTCNSPKRRRVEERLHEEHKEMPIIIERTSAIENEDTEEIEGDIIPKWLIGDDDEEEEDNDNDNDNSLLDGISIEVDGETEVKCTSRYTTELVKRET